jgi:hypothetical protein
MASAERHVQTLYALETYLYPHTVLCKSQAAYHYAPVGLRFGGGAAHSHHRSFSLYGQEREQASNQRHRVRAKRLCAPGRSATHGIPPCRAREPGCTHRDPVRSQARLLPSLSSGARWPDRTPFPVSTCHRRPERAYGRGSSAPCLCRVCFRVWPATSGRRGYPARRGQPPPRTPT